MPTALRPRPAEHRGLELVGHSDLEGRGDGMQIMRSGDVVYVGHMGDFGVGTTVLEIADPARPRVLRQIAVPKGTHSHKVQLADGLLLANHEQYPYRVGVPESAGLVVYDATKATDPRQIGFLPIDGLGVHRIWYAGGRYAYASARETGYRNRILIVVDLVDPTHPRLASRWWWPGQREDDGERLADDTDVGAHHVIVRGDRAYGGAFYAGGGGYSGRGGGGPLVVNPPFTAGRSGGPPPHQPPAPPRSR